MTYSTNIIFLDFDGVLTSKDSKTYFNPDDDGNYSYHETLIERLIQLCKTADAKIILATNWRKFMDDGCWYDLSGIRYNNPLPKLKQRLGDLIVGELPHNTKQSKSKALHEWFNANTIADDKNFVILDDDLNEGYQYCPQYVSHFILVNNSVGLSVSDYDMAKKILCIL